jgi:2-oxoglutarate ferredoxin oxidoreductase subunit alpha
MNPAALKVNLGDLVPGGAIIVNTDAFNDINLRKAGFAEDPLKNQSLQGYNLYEIPMSTMVAGACEGLGLSSKQVELTKNFFALGVMFWLYERSMAGTEKWIAEKFAGKDAIAEANRRALHAGYAFGETTEIFHTHYRVAAAHLPPGTYRNITGNEATALGFVMASKLAERDLFLASYPITPASDILHQLSSYKHLGIKTVQSEDEIAAIGAAVGAAYGGAMGMTTTSGPGMALKAEMLGLAVMVELPLVVVDVQRAGPSTGMPTKTEQGDLLMSMFGRNSDSPIPVIAPATPAECFTMAIEAWRIALHHMTPVVFLSDAFLATGAEPWSIPNVNDLPSIAVENAPASDKPGFRPYQRDPETLARPWAIPGTPGLEHRIGGLEKLDELGTVSYDPDNHHRMNLLRAEKVARVARDIPPTEIYGDTTGDLLILGWGSTYGSIRSAVERLQSRGKRVSHAHLRYLNPLPTDLGEMLKNFKHVLMPELNAGELRMLIRAKYLVDAVGFNLVRGKPFQIGEIEAKAESLLGESVEAAK